MTLSPELDDADFDPNENLDAVWEQRQRRIDLIRRNDDFERALAEERPEKHAKLDGKG